MSSSTPPTIPESNNEDENVAVASPAAPSIPATVPDENNETMEEEQNPHGVTDLLHSPQESATTSSTLSHLAAVVYEFQATLHESVFSSTLESSAAALAETLQHLLHIRQEEVVESAQERDNLRNELMNAGNEIHKLTEQMRKEREALVHSLIQQDMCGDEEGVSEESDHSPEKILADYTHAKGKIKLLEQDLEQARGVNRQVRGIMSSLIADNNALRQQVSELKISMVDRALYEEEVRNHQLTKHRLDQMKVEMEHIESIQQQVWSQHEALVQEQELVIQRYQLQLDHHLKEAERKKSASSPSGVSTHSGEEEENSNSSNSLYPAGIWSAGIKQLEARARMAVEQDNLEMEKKELEAHLAALQAEKEQESKERKQKEEEVNRLSLDAQELVFRNAVLSQQVASLLLKVDHLERQDRIRAEREECNGDTVGKGDEKRHPETILQELDNEEKEKTDSDTWHVRHRPAFLTHSGALAASMASAVLEERTAMTGTRSQKTATYAKTYPAPQPLHSTQSGHSKQSLLYTSPLDVMLAAIEPEKSGMNSSPIEVSSSLSQQLSAFVPQPSGHRTRQHALRNLGFSADASNASTGEVTAFLVTAPCQPCLPACDQLTGSALSRPSSHMVLDPQEGQTRAVGGNQILPPTLLDVMGDDHQHNGNDNNEKKNNINSYYPLDRFSVNTVEELVLRNQELLSQLYGVSQRAEETRQLLNFYQKGEVNIVSARPQPLCMQRVMGGIEIEVGNERSTVHGSPVVGAGSLSPLSSSITRDREASNPGSNPSTPCEALLQQQSAATKGSSTAEGVVEEKEKDLLQRLVDVSIQEHLLQHTHAQDHTLSAGLLSILEELKSYQSDEQYKADVRNEITGIMTSLVDLCCKQAVQIAQQAITEAAARKSPQMAAAGQDEFEKEHRHVLQRLLEDLRETLLTAVVNEDRPQVAQSISVSTSNDRASDAQGHHAQGRDTRGGSGVNFGRSDENAFRASSALNMIDSTHVELLQRLMRLLRSATQKEDLLQQVLRHAQQQRDPLMKLLQTVGKPEECEGLCDRCGSRTRKKLGSRRNGRKRLREDDEYLGQSGTPARVNPDLIGSAGLLPISSVPSSPLIPLSPLPPSTAVSRHPEGAQVYVREQSYSEEDEEEEEDSYLNQTKESEACMNGRKKKWCTKSTSSAFTCDGTLEQLQEQLAISQAARQRLSEELETEKNEHLSLLETMWKLEFERDSATATTAALKENISTMISPEKYQEALDKAMKAEETLQQLEITLKEQTEEVARLQSQTEEMERQAKEQVGQHEAGVAALEARILEKDSVLATHVAKEEEYAREETALQQQCLSWQQRSAEQNAHAQSLESQVRGLEAKVQRLQIEYFSQDEVQRALSDLFPTQEEFPEPDQNRTNQEDNNNNAFEKVPSSIIAHHRLNMRLVKEMREEREKLRAKLAHGTLHIQRLEDQIRTLKKELEDSQQQLQHLQLEALHRSRYEPIPVVGQNSSTITPPLKDSSVLEEEIKGLRNEMRLLHEREEGFKRRESQLREQLMVMSKDPVSEAARQYGIEHCKTMEEQLSVLHQRNVELKVEVENGTEHVRALEELLEKERQSLKESEENRQKLQLQWDDLLLRHNALQKTLEETEAALTSATELAASRELALSNRQSEIEELTALHQKANAEGEKLRSDNLELVPQLRALDEHLRASEEREKVLKKNLNDAEVALKKAKEYADIAIAQARNATPLGSTNIFHSSGVSQSKLRPRQVSLTRAFRDGRVLPGDGALN